MGKLGTNRASIASKKSSKRMGPSTALKARSVTAFPPRAELSIHPRKAVIIYTSPMRVRGVSFLPVGYGIHRSSIWRQGRNVYRSLYVTLGIAASISLAYLIHAPALTLTFPQLTVP